MTADEEQLVLDTVTGFPVESENLICETLPLRLLASGIVGGICSVCAVDQTEISIQKVERACICRCFILEKVACHGGVIDVRARSRWRCKDAGEAACYGSYEDKRS